MKRIFAAVAVAIAGACVETTPLDVERSASISAARHGGDASVCENLNVPAGARLSLRVYAQGVQIYRWNGAGWSFVGPEAALTADEAGNGKIGDHYAGPTWESVSGSKVVGAVVDRCTPDASAIPWLLLRAVSSDGPGVFNGVTYIQRINTVSGNAPAQAGAVVGEEARVPYTTEYLFYE